MKTYGWQSPETLKRINSDPKIIDLLYDLGLLPEEVSARVRRYVEDAVAEERERCAKIAEERGCETTHMCCERVAKFIREG
jgi:hypothetical protein